jgi:hypothetical protein
VLLPPSPKFQDQLLGDPVEASVKLTAKGAVPLVGLALKFATGAATGAGDTVTTLEVLLEPLALETVNVAVKVPVLL